MSELSKLPNIGAKLTLQLARVGISTPEELKRRAAGKRGCVSRRSTPRPA